VATLVAGCATEGPGVPVALVGRAEESPAYVIAPESLSKLRPNPPSDAKMLPPDVGNTLRVSDMEGDERYRPRLAPPLQRQGMRVWGRYRVCVDVTGAVLHVTAIRAADHLVHDDWVKRIRTVVHRPYLSDGAAFPFCYPLRIEIQVR
jgi:hypothetical protein